MLTMMHAMAALLAAEAAAQLPGWLAGCWISEERDRWTEECWTQPRGGMMLGASHSGHGDTADFWETARIVLNHTDAASGEGDRMVFLASPRGAPATPFAWQAGRGDGVTFFNAGNEYPQRIRYWRDGSVLHAEISRADGSRPVRWRFRRRE